LPTDSTATGDTDDRGAMARIDPPEESDLSDRDRELLAEISDIHGFVPNQHELEAHFPLLLRSLLDLNRRVMLAGDLDPTLLETIALILADETDCEYCFHYHAMQLANRSGVDRADVEALQGNWRSANFSPRRQALVEFALTINADPHAVTDEDVADLREHGLTAQDLVQLVHFVNVMRGYNLFNVVFGTERDEESGGWTH
jgi:uncharacterized peroxidase-related enzyme